MLAVVFASSVARAEQLPATDDEVALEVVSRGVLRLVELQEGDERAEWPYEGVYRVREGEAREPVIPIGYRVGGTSIVGSAMIEAERTLAASPGDPGSDDARIARRRAVERAIAFVAASIDQPLMSPDDIPGTYDVRGWGYTYGLSFLLLALRADFVADDSGDDVSDAIEFFIEGIEATEIPEDGGWNYARRGGFDDRSDPSPFMTAPTLIALFQAKSQGFDVDDDVVERGLKSLERARQDSGAYVYSGRSRAADDRSQVPGAAARMAAAETALLLAGRSSVDRVRGSIDAFIVHWDWLDQRRAQPGTHIGPYGIAPYYFYFGHFHAAMAVELLPEIDREEYRRRLRNLLIRNRLDDGTWNDRVFERSANYGTAMAIMALVMKDIEPPARWTAE
jgi:hypothetical protein